MAACALLLLGAGCAHRRIDRVMAGAIAAQQGGAADMAHDGYERALELDDRVYGAANNLALLALAAGDQAKAVDLLARELAAHPALPEARLNRALLFVRAGRYVDADPELAPGPGVGAAPRVV